MFSLSYRELWANTSQWLTDELDQMAASAQAKWGKQHTAEGGHGAVTASSLTAPILNLGPTYEHVIPVSECQGDNGRSLVLPERVSSLIIRTHPSAGTHASIDTIEMPGQQFGDVLAVFPIPSARLNSKAIGVYTTRAPGHRLMLAPTSVSSVTYGGDTFGQTTTSTVRGLLLMWLDRVDYTDSLYDTFPCWVQIG